MVGGYQRRLRCIQYRILTSAFGRPGCFVFERGNGELAQAVDGAFRYVLADRFRVFAHFFVEQLHLLVVGERIVCGERLGEFIRLLLVAGVKNLLCKLFAYLCEKRPYQHADAVGRKERNHVFP